MEKLDEIVMRLTEDQILSLFYAAGCKEPNSLPKPKGGWTTIRCYGHDDSENKKEGKRASLAVNVHTGGYKCRSCGRSGNLLSIAKLINGNDNGREALELLAAEAKVSLDGSQPVKKYKPIPQKPKEEPKPIEYVCFDASKPFVHVDIERWLPKFQEMNEVQQYKMILTAIYRESLKTDQTKKLAYYEGRGIKNSKKNIELIGFISANDSSFWKPIEAWFGLEKLIDFGFYQPATAKWHPLSWKFGGGDVCFVPSFDLYTDMLTGAMLRPLKKPTNGQKEFSLNQPKLVSPLPFKLSREILLSEKPIWMTEGSVDGLSLGDEENFASLPGVNGLPDELLGLFKGKTVILGLDQDRAGQEAAWGFTDEKEVFHDGLKQKLLKAGAFKVLVANWDISLGKDLNDLLKSGHLYRNGKLAIALNVNRQ